MIIATSIVLIVTSLLMVVLVLMHKGKGGGLSDMFGGGISSSLGGSSVVERNLDRLTIGVGLRSSIASTRREAPTTTASPALSMNSRPVTSKTRREGSVARAASRAALAAS